MKERRIAAFRRHAPLACGLAIIIAWYAFVVGAGHVGGWFSWSHLYDAQAEGLRSGHLYLPEVPSKALQALPDPYDPSNMRLWRWDHTYYRGHFYLYWGLVPALLLAAFKTVFRVRATVGDEVLTFWLFVGRLLVGTFLIRALAARLAATPPRWAVGLAIAVFALANPTPYTLARGAVYEVAIMAGVLFMLGGLALAWQGLLTQRARAPLWLAAASVSFGCAGGSRTNLLPAVVLIALWTAYARWRVDGGGWPRLWRLSLAAGAPAAAIALLHFGLNHLRFDDWREFGARYQLGNHLLALDLRFVLTDLFIYGFLPARPSCTFPFLSTPWTSARSLIPDWLPVSTDVRMNEPGMGLLIAIPFVGLAAGAALVAAVRWYRRRAAGVPAAPRAPRSWAWRWLGGALALYLACAGLPIVLLSATTMRYELDFVSPLLLLSILGGWWLLSLARGKTRIAVAVAFATMAIVSIAIGLLLGFTGYFNHFSRHNPALMQRLERTLNVCGR